MAPPTAIDRRTARDRAALSSTPVDDLVVLSQHRLWRVRAAVAANPATPPDVLARLTDDPHPRVRRRIVRNPASTEAHWLRILRDPVRANRERVVLHHPTAQVLVTASAEPWFTDHADRILVRRLAQDDEDGVRAAAALACGEAPLRVLAAGAARIDPSDVVRLASDGNEGVRSAVARRCNLAPELFARLAADRSELVVRSIAANPAIPRPLARKLRKGPEEVRVALASNVALPGPFLAKLMGRGGARTAALQRALAANPSTPPAVLQDLARKPLAGVRAALASNASTPEAVLRGLARSGSPNDAAAVAMNPSLPEDEIEQIVARGIRTASFAAAHRPSLRPQHRVRLIGWVDPHVRGIALVHPSATTDELHHLATSLDAEAWVLRRVAHHANCRADDRDAILTWLALGGHGAQDPYFDPTSCTGHPGDTSLQANVEWHRLAVASLGFTTPSPLWHVRALAVSMLDDPERVHAYVDDPHPEVRLRCVRRTSYFADVAVLADDENEVVRRTARRSIEHLPTQQSRLTRVVDKSASVIRFAWAPLIILGLWWALAYRPGTDQSTMLGSASRPASIAQTAVSVTPTVATTPAPTTPAPTTATTPPTTRPPAVASFPTYLPATPSDVPGTLAASASNRARAIIPIGTGVLEWSTEPASGGYTGTVEVSASTDRIVVMVEFPGQLPSLLSVGPGEARTVAATAPKGTRVVVRLPDDSARWVLIFDTCRPGPFVPSCRT